MIKARTLAFLAAAASLAAISPPAAAQPPAQPSPAAASARDPVAERIEDLVRIWYFARLFHPDLAGSSPAWEAALVAAVPAAQGARDDVEFAAAVDRMLASAGQSSAIAPPAPPTPGVGSSAAPPAFRIEEGAAIASCFGITRIESQAAFDAALEPVKAASAARGMVLDCRFIPPAIAAFLPAAAFQSWMAEATGIVPDPAAAPGRQRMRFHDGYPTESGYTSGGYQQGTALIEQVQERRDARPPAPATAPQLVILVDGGTPNALEVVGNLRSTGRVRLVAEGVPLREAQQVLALPHVTARIAISEYVGPDGAAPAPDGCIAPGHAAEALHLAISMLDPSVPGPACPPLQPAARTQARPAAPSDPATLPSVGERVLALAKLWGGIRYFYPYQQLLDQPWDGLLRASVPSFLGAETRAAYEEAVQHLAHMIQDTHVGVSGQKESFLGRRRWLPPVYVRPVGTSYVIMALHDPALADRIRPGDEILAVDGRPPAAIAAEIGDRLSSSTPQSLARFTASALLAGPEGSSVRLTLTHGDGRSFEVTLARALAPQVAVGRPADPSPAWRRLAPDIGYVDLERLSRSDANRALDELMDTRAIVFDLRGYPQGTAWVIAPRLALPGRDGAVAASFRRPHYVGPAEPMGELSAFEQRLPLTDKPHYHGRIIVLIDDRAISQSEHTALFFKAAANPVFVGAPTAGANGDVTSILLPGGLEVRFTGHDVRYPDGRQLQRVGIQPDVRVAPTLRGIRAGRDEVMEAGLRLARARDGGR
jgi:C-terminal processing protease CtpA/Prc